MPEADRSHVIGLTLAAAASGLVVSAGALAFGAFTLWQAALAAVAAIILGLITTLPWARDAAALRARSRAIGEGESAPLPAEIGRAHV